ncbi:MAG: family 78 glycoside hydrolase catalytic domain [Saprospiraceae bacterium]|nr:family 78 glycoside hydrolase catalytic domain [Saprospiraceae bacterium]
MKSPINKIFISAFIASLSLFFLPASANEILTHLRVNYQEKPLGLDAENLCFSWQMDVSDDSRGKYQTAYQIVVTDESKVKVWDSGKVITDISLGIKYEGKNLQPTTRYDWQLTVWNQTAKRLTNTSWFETGLKPSDNNLSSWSNATWIGAGEEDLVLYSHYLPVFKIDYQMQLDSLSNSTKAAFVFGANDRRNMDKDKNLKAMSNGKDESHIALELDISPMNRDRDGLAQLHVYRVGYTPEDNAKTPFKTYPIPKNLLNQKNKYEPHQFYLELNLGVLEIYLNGKEYKHKIIVSENPGGSPFGRSGLNLNPYGWGHDFICYPLLADIGFSLRPGQKASFTNLNIRNYRPPSNTLFALDKREFEKSDQPQFILFDPSHGAAPLLRTEFFAEKKVLKKARLYVTARGIYEMYLNGQRIGDDYFNPGLTQYNKHHLYQTYDVTNQIKGGKVNALGSWLSEGWWSGGITFRGENWNYFGDRQSLLCKLVLNYEDGTEDIIISNDKTWKSFSEGPIRYGSFFQGEVYDATKDAAIDGWTTAGYNDSHWKEARQIYLEGTTPTGNLSDFTGRKINLDFDDFELTGQIGQNVQVVESLTAQNVEEVRPGVFVYDMGQNMVGFPSITLDTGQKGDTITIRYAEVKYPDLPEYESNTGMIMLENIRAALAQDLYIRKGGQEVIQPRFTFHGYRFLEITGIKQALPLESVRGHVLSSIHNLASHYETSNPLVNRLWQNITWSLRGNFLSIPTDTPARNERMGWNGDINVFSRAATWLADVNLFLKRHLMAMRDMQMEDGKFTDVAPVGGGFGGTLWGSAGIVIAWEIYQQYGDMGMLKEHYDAMKRYILFLDTRMDSNGILVEGPLGDWLSPENDKNDNSLLWTAYHIYNLDIMGKIAKVLDKKEDRSFFEKRYQERKDFFNKTYVDPNHHKTIKSGVKIASFGPPSHPSDKGKLVDTQASYAIPLAFNVFNQMHKEAAIEHLSNTITRRNQDDDGILRPAYSLMTGFIGTASLGEALSENGKIDLAYRLLQQESYPSWLYPVINGATTIWERLNSYTIDQGFGGNNSMNSFNHYAFGAVASWMYNYSLGIQRDPRHPGFKHFILKPEPDPSGQMRFAKGHYDSMYGTIVSEWHQEEQSTRYIFTVPANTTATLFLPAKNLDEIKEGNQTIKNTPGIAYKGRKNDKLVFEIESGHYDFMIKMP